MPTTNLSLAYLVSAQNQPEVTANSDWDTIDNVLFVRRGTLAARPASLPAGALYVATDVGNEGIYYSTAPGTWVNVTPGNGVHASWKGGTAPTVAAAAANGTSPPTPLMDTGANDERGGVTWGTGTGATNGAQITVTFAVPYATAPTVIVSPRSGLTYNSGLNVASTTTTFTIAAAGTPSSGQSTGAYTAFYVVVG